MLNLSTTLFDIFKHDYYSSSTCNGLEVHMGSFFEFVGFVVVVLFTVSMIPFAVRAAFCVCDLWKNRRCAKGDDEGA